MSKSFQVWECKIIVSADAELPDEFDIVPRRAAMNAIANTGITVLACFSGWGGELTAVQEQVLDERSKL